MHHPLFGSQPHTTLFNSPFPFPTNFIPFPSNPFSTNLVHSNPFAKNPWRFLAVARLSCESSAAAFFAFGPCAVSHVPPLWPSPSSPWELGGGLFCLRTTPLPLAAKGENHQQSERRCATLSPLGHFSPRTAPRHARRPPPRRTTPHTALRTAPHTRAAHPSHAPPHPRTHSSPPPTPTAAPTPNLLSTPHAPPSPLPLALLSPRRAHQNRPPLPACEAASPTFFLPPPPPSPPRPHRRLPAAAPPRLLPPPRRPPPERVPPPTRQHRHRRRRRRRRNAADRRRRTAPTLLHLSRPRR